VEALYLNWLGERLLDRPTGVTTDDPRCLSDALTERLVDYLWNLHVTNAPALTFVVEAEVEETAATARRGTYGCCPPDPRYSNTGRALLTDPVAVHIPLSLMAPARVFLDQDGEGRYETERDRVGFRRSTS
jgi:hypothetical protein